MWIVSERPLDRVHMDQFVLRDVSYKFLVGLCTTFWANTSI